MKSNLFFLSIFNLFFFQKNILSESCENLKKPNLNLLGYKINSPIGISACPITTSAGIKVLSKLDYSIFTYKTIRSHYQPIFSGDIYLVDKEEQLTKKDLNSKFKLLNRSVDSYDKLAITNSFGINSLDPESTIKDISKAKAELSEGQVLIVSIYGSGNTKQDQIKDFVEAAKIAAAGGAQIIEANLSCPNVCNKEFVYKNPSLVSEICSEIVKEAKNIPVIIKVGFFDDINQTLSIIIAAHKAGVSGICGINTVPAKIVDTKNKPVYGAEHETSGISGAPIFNLTLEFIKDCRKIIDEEKLNFTLLATGGVIKQEQFDILLAAGADVALCATGAMRNNNIAQEYNKNHKPVCDQHKKSLIKELNNIGAIKIENVTLKGGLVSPIYFDMRIIISHPELLKKIAVEVKKQLNATNIDLLCGVPYAAVPLAAVVSSITNIPMILQRKEAKSYGTKKLIEGNFKTGDSCLIIEDVIVSGASILETTKVLEDHYLSTKKIIVLIDREQGGIDNIKKAGYNIQSIFKITEILQVLLEEQIINHKQFATIKQFCADNQV